jgi:hypothetical protein
MKHLITKTHNGKPVYVDLIHSQAAAHIAAQPRLLSLVEEVLRQTRVDTPTMHIEQDMGREIGYSFVVKTSESDTILYARLIRDQTYTRFIKNGKPLATKYLSILLGVDPSGSYELQDTWIGRLRPPRPGSNNETTTSKPYWENHAFVFDGQAMQARTVTKVCPY